MTEHIVAIFESDARAAAAAASLTNAGIPASAIRQYARDGQVGHEVERTDVHTDAHTGGGFWSWLFGEEHSTTTTRADYDGDIDAYDRRVASGNTVLSVLLENDSQIHEAISILETHHPLGIDEHTEDAEAHELPGVHAGADTTSVSSAGMDYSTGIVAQPNAGTVAAPVRPPTTTLGADTVMAAAPADRSAGSMPERDEVIPLSEEQLSVGKRSVDRGTTRIRRYVVETPVEQNVTLHGERVTIERRQPVETAVPGGSAFEERVVEVHETEEVPVVQKTARVVEEVAVRREATDRTETVKDTVRREEVEVNSSNGEKVR